MRGVCRLILILLSGANVISLAEEGVIADTSLPLSNDDHLETPLATATAKNTQSNFDQAAAAISVAASSAATTAAEAVGSFYAHGNGEEETSVRGLGCDAGSDQVDILASGECRSDESDIDPTDAAYQESDPTIDISAAEEPEDLENSPANIAFLSKREDRGVEREKNADDGGLSSTIPVLELSEPLVWEDAVEADGENNDNLFDSFAEAGTDEVLARRGGRWDMFFHGWWRHQNDQEGGRLPFKGALRSYDSLLKKHYAKMSFFQATALGAVGDVIAQRLERRWNPGQKFEWRRTAHAGALNMVIDGIFTPQWYNAVDRVNSDMTLRAALAKALAASTLYSPFANGIFLAGARVLRYGTRVRFNWDAWRRQLIVCTVRDFEMWPPLHVLNFWLVPRHWRPLAGHLAGVALLFVISSTGLTDAGLPLGQRALPLAMRWGRRAADAVAGRVRAKR